MTVINPPERKLAKCTFVQSIELKIRLGFLVHVHALKLGLNTLWAELGEGTPFVETRFTRGIFSRETKWKSIEE